jgi:subtilisin family serine protease
MKKLSKVYMILLAFIISLIFVRNSDATIRTNFQIQEEGIKRITVEAPLPHALPRDSKLWLRDVEKITPILKYLNAKIVKSYPDYAFSVIDVPIKNYDKLTKLLKVMKYVVNDDKPTVLYLNESVNAIGVPSVWRDYGLTGKNRVIAIIDSGIDCHHQDFNDCTPDNEGKILNTYDATGRNSIIDVYGHGTITASIAAGTGYASSGKFKGIAPDAGLLIAKAFYPNEIADSINWAINDTDHPLPDVISISMGWDSPTIDMCDGNENSNSNYKLVYDAIMQAIDKGVVVVAAAGNSVPVSNTIAFPACMNDVIAVGSALKKDYPDHRFEVNTNLPHDDTAEVHVIINISSENRVVFDRTWEGPTSYTGEISGFQYVFQPLRFPATVEVKIEGEHRLRNCFPSDCSNPECISWEPGNSSKGDDFWSFGSYFSSGPYIAADIFVQPIGNGRSCLPGDIGWWDKYYTIYIPPNYVNIYKVSSLSTEGLVYYDSSRGPSLQGTTKPDVTAPGLYICATKASGTEIGESSCGNDNYVSSSGTSVAAPHVAGLVALLKEAYPSISYSYIVQALKTKTDEKILEGSPDNTEGYGRINALKAIDFIRSCPFKNWDCPGDANGDGIVDMSDVSMLNVHWYDPPLVGSLGYDCATDFNSDGFIDIFDKAIINANWKRTC